MTDKEQNQLERAEVCKEIREIIIRLEDLKTNRCFDETEEESIELAIDELHYSIS